MLSKEKYDQVLDKLEEFLKDSSDLVSVEAYPYGDFITSSGKIDSRKGSFFVRFNLLQYNVGAEKFTFVLAQMTKTIYSWMNHFPDIYWTYNFKSVNGENSRIEIDIKFNDLKSVTKKILTK